MLPISPRAETAISSAGSTPSRPHSVAASPSPSSSSTVADMSPLTPITTPVTTRSAGPTASTASAKASASAVGTEMSTLRPSIADSDVLAVPEPMLASSRRASSCRSLNWGLKGVSFLGGDGGGDTGGGALAERVAVDDEGDLAVGEHGAAGQRGVLGDLAGQRAGDELALAHQTRDAQHEPGVGRAHDDAV